MRLRLHLVGLDRRARRNIPIELSFLFFLALASPLYAQVGNQNPAGVSGIFNGQVDTGCSYDPYTGNATRSVTDIAVAGAVGEYPLALVRTANSRTPSTTEVFGWAGGWNHNYNWILEDSPSGNTQNFHPTRYTVDFPDGRVETFRAVTWDSVYRVRPGADIPAQSTSAGMRERFVPLNTNTMYAYLVLPDGGAVEFKASQYLANGHYYYKYHATGIYDAYGLKTTLVDEVVPNGTRRRLVWVIDPSGQRNLNFTYAGLNSPLIASVTASDGRTVNYYYVYCNGCRLDRVRYYNNAAWDARYQYTNSNIGGELPPLLQTCDDAMYPGPMKRIAYEYKTGTNADQSPAVYGQILRERYWDGVSGPTSGTIVSTLTVGAANPINHNIRTETRGDNKTRTFTYTAAGYVISFTDFMNPAYSASQGYDAYNYISYVTDRNGHRTDFTNDSITGNVVQIQYPFTHGDTPNQGARPTVNYTYTNSYYLHTVQDEGSHTTTFTRNSNNRVTRIDYPDGGYETFGYDPGHFYKLSSHRMTTGGTETFAYDGSSRLQYYSDPDHSNPNTPSSHYFYDGHGWVGGILDALGHPTNFDYNDRDQLTVATLATDPSDNQRHTITNVYSPDGSLRSTTDQLGHMTQYTYDDYRRLKSVTLPARGDGTGTHTTSYYYDAYGTGDDYKYTDSNVSWIKLHSAKKAKTVYDDNRRKQSITVAPNTADQATTSYGYDGVGNVTRVTNPRGRATATVYDERNRPSEVHDTYGNITRFTYDTAGHRKTINRPNGQVITNASFDEMNRVLQQNVTRTPDPQTVTKYTYYPSGLLSTLTDPRNSTDGYSYTYDLMGRQNWVTYPADLNGNHWTEHFTYDTSGRLETFKNREGNTQTFSYDALNRMTGFSWDDTPRTPSVTFAYDAASRLTGINNTKATITRAYLNDNLLLSETETITGGSAKTVSYTYNDDGIRASIDYPDYQAFAYTYTGRSQLRSVGPWATYTYDENGYIGDLTARALNNGTQSNYLYDPLDRVTWITHSLSSGSRGFNYGYDNVSLGNRKYIRRTGTTLGDKGDVFSYDLADQASGVQLNVTSPQGMPPPPRSIFYDANGNRTTFQPYGRTDTYGLNNLNQYTSRNSNNATYDANGNMAVTPEPQASRSLYTYDAQNRVLSASKSGGGMMSFTYDGLNRQVSRTIDGVTTYNVYDGWDLIEEYQTGGAATAKYVHGPSGLVKELVNNHYYYQDGSGSTSHLADSNGNLLEWYRYDLQGTPFFYAPNDTQRSTSNYSVRHLFTGQQWYSDVGLYDLRNRFYSPDIGRFLQPDPIGFRGDRSNLYRYCGNNPVTRWDPFGLQVPTPEEKGGVTVYGAPIERGWAPGGGLGSPIGGAPSEPGLTGHLVGDKYVSDYNPFPRPPEDDQPSVQHPAPSSVPAQNPPQPSIDPSHPTTTAEFIIAGNMIEHGNTMDTTPAFDLVDLFSGGIAGLVRSSIRSVAAERTAVFWAGGRAAENAARTFARANNGVVIGDTAAGRAVAQSTANVPWSQARSQWLSLSEDFARSASGEVNVFQNARGVAVDSIWRNEYQILRRNPNVTGINFSVVMPDGSVVPVP